MALHVKYTYTRPVLPHGTTDLVQQLIIRLRLRPRFSQIQDLVCISALRYLLFLALQVLAVPPYALLVQDRLSE